MSHSVYILIKIEDVSLESEVPENVEHTIVSLLQLIPNNWATNLIDTRALEITKDVTDSAVVSCLEYFKCFDLED